MIPDREADACDCGCQGAPEPRVAEPFPQLFPQVVYSSPGVQELARRHLGAGPQATLSSPYVPRMGWTGPHAVDVALSPPMPSLVEPGGPPEPFRAQRVRLIVERWHLAGRLVVGVHASPEDEAAIARHFAAHAA